MSNDSITLYDGSIVTATCAVKSLAHLITVVEGHRDPASFLLARLCKDMEPLTFQVECVTAIAQRMLAHLSGTNPLEDDDDSMVSYSDMHGRIELLCAADKNAINSRANEPVSVGMGPDKPFVNIPSSDYANTAAMPNVFFHLSIAHAILPNKGVPLGKGDYMDSFFTRYHPLGQ